MPKICHMAKKIDMYLWAKYANIHATYEWLPKMIQPDYYTQMLQDDADDANYATASLHILS